MKRSLGYLNGVLSLIAVLLTLNLWAMWNVSPGGQVMTIAGQAQAQGASGAAVQRKEMVSELRKLNKEMVVIKDMFKKGEAKVQAKVLAEKKTSDKKMRRRSK